MHRALSASSVLLLTLAAACGSGQAAETSGSGAESSESSAVPAGVAEQYATLAEEVEEHGGRTTSGEWTVSYVVEDAEPWYAAHGGQQRFREPTAGETHHIEIIPTQRSTGRIVPDVPVSLEVVDADGTVVDRTELHFLYSTFFHYADNVSVPEKGTYSLRATLGAPDFLRHGEENQRPPLTEGTTVTFEEVELD